VYRVRCGEIWGGIRDADLELRTGNVSASLYSAASGGDTGGDIYYVSVCDRDKLTRMAVADVRGHGQGVSLLSRGLYEALADNMNSLQGSDVLSALNKLAVAQGIEAMATAAVVAFHMDSSQLYFAYAGHPPALIWCTEDRVWHPALLQPSEAWANLPLGVFTDVSYEQMRVPLTRGDRVLLYTDGLTESPGVDGEFFGEDRLLEVLNETGSMSLTELKSAVLDAIRRHTQGAAMPDDVTLLVMEIT